MKKTIIGIILILLSVAGIIGWEMFGREELMYSDMLVLNKDVEAYEIVTKDMLAIRKVYNPMDSAYRLEDLDTLIGKETTQYIEKGSELFPRYFEEPKLTIDPKNNYVLSIDVSSLQAYPRSIKKGDTAYLYLGSTLVTTLTIIAIKDSLGVEVTKEEDGKSGLISSIEFKASEDDVKEISELILNGERMILTYN